MISEYIEKQMQQFNGNLTEKISLFKEMSVFTPSSLRFSLSPLKIKKASKKFFHSNANKLIKLCDNESTENNEFQGLLRKQKIILTSKKTKLNKMAINEEIETRESQLLTFPNIDSKKVEEKQLTPVYYRKERDHSAIEILSSLEEVRRSRHSNIFFNAVNVEAILPSEINEVKSAKIPKIDQRRTNSQVTANSPIPPQKSSMLKLRSVIKFENIERIQKVYKKGYLVYEPEAQRLYDTYKHNINSQPTNKLDNQKLITAKSFYVLEADTLKPIMTRMSQQEIEIASLTKIMTCFLTLLICKKYEIDMTKCTYRVPDKIADTPGTSAELEAGDLLTIEELLYGLMLPSGNDASICIAELMGKMIQKCKKKQDKRTYYETFIGHMNYFSRELGLQQIWGNCSGLSLNPNFSTPEAIIILSALAMKNDFFKKIVGTKEITIDIKNDRYGLSKKKSWRNTNRLLDKGWEGVKTGTTETAGHCLISKKENWLIGVFDCQTMSKRFSQCTKLHDYLAGK